MKRKQIKLLESYIDKQINNFNSYMNIQNLIKEDIHNQDLEKLENHILSENLILTKIIKMSKIIENAIFDFKIKYIEKHPILLKKKMVLEDLKDTAIKMNLENRDFLEQKKEALKENYKEPPIDIKNPYFLKEQASFIDVKI